ncbi:hypothetical protein ABZ901_00770 [Actinacidiphila alni]|uniref:hypothetical protein n=1 Tax=Actinacidiphila alni TaxID=380248 RepID=UPI0034069D9A
MLSIPEAVWNLLLDAFASAPRGHERVAYLDGVRFYDEHGDLHGLVTTVTVPDAVTSLGNYRVSAAAMEQAGAHFEPLGLVRLAQVHTHGNHHVTHSSVDDRHAYSQRDGAVSLVLPYSAVHRPSPENAGVHVREAAGWRRVSEPQICQVLRLVPSLIDLRSSGAPWNGSPADTKAISKGGWLLSKMLSRLPWR